MPIWLYQMQAIYVALIIVALIESLAMIGLFLIRKFVLPRLGVTLETNDAVSGTVQAIGVFYGITVGLIAVGVWNANSDASVIVSKEAAAIASLYRDTGGYPSPLREELRAKLREYTIFIIDEAWPEQRRGIVGLHGTMIMNDFQTKLTSFGPLSPSQIALHDETLRAYNELIEYRTLRIDKINSGLSGVMWVVIWVGAAISIGIGYFYKIADARVHAILISLMSGFLAILIFMIVINDRPFYGTASLSSAPYQMILNRLIDGKQP